MEDDERTRKEMVFQTIRPLCIKLSRIPLQLSQKEKLSSGEINEEMIIRDIGQLMMTIKGLDESYDSSLTYLIEYILFPLEAILKALATNDKELPRGVTSIYLAIVRLYESLLGRMQIRKMTLFHRVLMLMESLKTKYSSRFMEATVTQEDLVLTILNCEILLLEHLDEELRQTIWEEQESTEESNKPRLVLAHSLGTTLSLIETTRNREIKLTGCQLIQTWARSVNPKESHLLRKFLPGMMSGLIRLILSSSQRDPHVLGVEYLETLGIYIRSSLTSITTITATITTVNSNHSTSNMLDLDEPMNTVFSRLLDQTQWMHDRVRSTLLRLAFEMVRDYGDLIPQTTDSLLDYLVGNTVSSEQEILAEESRAWLKCLIDDERDNDDTTQHYLMVEKLKRRVSELIDKLPSIVSLSDEEPKRMLLESLVGYLTFLGVRSRTLLESCFSRVVSSLLNLACLKRDITLIGDRNAMVHMEDLQGPIKIENTHFSRKRFEYFNNEQMEDCLARLIELWTHYGNPLLMIEHFLGMLRDSDADSSLHCEIIFLLNHVVIGLCSDRTTQGQSIMLDQMIRLIFSTYMESTVWFAPLGRKDVEDYWDLREALSSDKSLASNDRHHLSSRQLGDFALKISLMLEGIAIIAKFYTREFRGWLVDCLYIMIEKLGEPNAVVSRTALCALTNLAMSCDYPSIREMVLDNVDYLVNTISLYLRHLEEHPRLPYMLHAIVGIMKEHFVEYMDDTFAEIFDVLDRCERRSIILEPFLRMFATLIDVFSTCMPPGKSEEIQDSCPSPDESTSTHETRLDTFLFQIVERMIHLLSSDDPKIRQLSLDILTKATPLMTDARQSKFLPLVHLFWPGVIRRLDDAEHYVILSALSLVKILIPNTQGFLSARIGNDLWPSLKRFLSHHTTRPMSILAQAQRDPLFNYSTPFKLLHAILDLLSEIGVGTESLLQLKPSIIQEMMMMSFAFLDDRLRENNLCKPIVDTTLLLFDRFSQYHGHRLFCLLLPLIHSLPAHLENPPLDFNSLEVPACLKEAAIHQILVNNETLHFLQTPLFNLLHRLTLQHVR